MRSRESMSERFPSVSASCTALAGKRVICEAEPFGLFSVTSMEVARSTKMRKAAMAACFVGVTSFGAVAESAFEGVWEVKDTAGRRMARASR